MSVMCIFIPFVCFRSIIIVKRITNILVVILSLSIFLITTRIWELMYFHNTTCVTFVPDVRFYDAMDLSSALLTFSSISMVLITYSLYSVKYTLNLHWPATTPSLRIWAVQLECDYYVSYPGKLRLFTLATATHLYLPFWIILGWWNRLNCPWNDQKCRWRSWHHKNETRHERPMALSYKGVR